MYTIDTCGGGIRGSAARQGGDLLDTALEIDFVKAYRHRPGERVPDQFHTCYELVYYFDGDGSTTIGGQTHALRPNTFSLIRPKAVHSELHAGPSEVLFIGFHGTFREPEGNLFLPDTPDGSIGAALRAIYEEHISNRQDATKAMLLHLRLLLLYISRLTRKGPPSGGSAQMQFAANYIGQYCTGSINWQELAASYHYSYDYFRHLFKTELGMSPAQYLIRARLNLARRLLEEGDLNCTEIAYQCGFASSAHLSAQFQRVFGQSPLKYRALHRQQTGKT